MEPKPVRDDAGAQRTIRDAVDRRVPDELLEELKRADGRLHDVRQRLEAAEADAEYAKAERVAAIGEELRSAEREIEEITRRIDGDLPRPAGGG